MAKDLRNLCCQDPENLLVLPDDQAQAASPAEVVRRCRVCRARHFELTVEPGVIAMRGHGVELVAWTVPDGAILFSEDLRAVVDGFGGAFVLAGCVVTAQGSPDMTVAVAAGVIASAGVPVAVAAGNVTITTADATNPRIDLIVASAAGAKSAVAGTPAASPTPPAVPAGSVLLYRIDLPADDTTIGAAQITDKRVVRPQLPLTLHRDTATVDVVSSTAEVSLFTAAPSIVAGLLGTTGELTLFMSGIITKNASGTPTLRIKLGATTIFTDALTIANSASPHRWNLLVSIANAGATNAQRADALFLMDRAVAGTFAIQDVQTGYTVGLGAAGVAAEDTTAAKVLDVTLQWSASSASLSWQRHKARVGYLP